MKTLLIFCLAILSLPSVAQKKPWPRPMRTAETKLEKYNCQCVHRNTYTAAQRLKFYPFNKAAKIQLVSFYNGAEPNREVRIGDDTTTYVFKWKYPFNNDKIDTSKFFETLVLNKKQINELTGLLYNLDIRKVEPDIVFPGTKCFEPRNAILFLNKVGKIFARIEICFQCEDMQGTPYKVNYGGYCTEKVKMIKRYFKLAGIEFGVTTLEIPK